MIGESAAGSSSGPDPAVGDCAFDDLDGRRLHDIVRLRVDVFVVEQECPYPELDGRDVEAGTRHLWIDDDEGVASYLRLLDDGETTRIGRVVTASRARGAGLSARLMRHALATSQPPWVLDAQAHLTDWYARFGFAPIGAVFDEDGIDHQRMIRGS